MKSKSRFRIAIERPRLGLRVFIILTWVAALFHGLSGRCNAAEVFSRPDYRNTVFWPYPEPVPGASVRQAESVAVINGTVGAAGSASTPSDGSVYLVRAVIGQPAGGIPFRIAGERTYRIGEEIVPATALGANGAVAPGSVGPDSRLAKFVPGLDRLVATSPGFVEVEWIRNDGSTNSPVRYYIEPAPLRDPVGLYHTHASEGNLSNDLDRLTWVPPVRVPSGIQIDILHNPALPDATVLQFESMSREMRARRNVGLVVIVYRDASASYLDLEIVQIKANQPEGAATLAEIGFEVLPYVTKTNPAKPWVSSGLNSQNVAQSFVYQHEVEGSLQYGKVFAVRKTVTETDIEVYWRRYGVQGLVWPYELHRYVADWPSDRANYQRYVRGSTSIKGPDVELPAALNAMLMPFQEPEGHASDIVQNRFITSGVGWSLLKYSPSNGIVFQVVRSILHNDPDWFNLAAQDWSIGLEITEQTHEGVRAGYIHAPEGDRYDWETYEGTADQPSGWETNWTTQQIFPVNTGNLEVWWSNLRHGVQWPSLVKRYAAVWPTETEPIVIASQRGSGPISPVTHQNFKIYYQNDPTLAGYNPNDEHAFVFNAFGEQQGSSQAVFALRDDLGTDTTSLPYVLLKYRDPEDGLLWRFRVFHVIAEGVAADGQAYSFSYPATAGILIQLPYPVSYLNFVQPCTENAGVSGPYWRDRKEDYWARAAGDDGGTAEIVMRYFYSTNALPGAYFPPSKPAVAGPNVAWLDRRPSGTPGVPTDISYTVVWPEQVPNLRVSETLAKPKVGLPAIRGQTSVEVIYQQSVATLGRSSVVLIDPTHERRVSLAQLPSDLPNASEGGKFFFPTLPPQLRTRLWWDPVNHLLKFKGEFIEPVAGEYYLLVNVITPRERDILLNASTDSRFIAAVSALSTQASVATEVPPNTPFDSLALTAGLGTGTGFVTLVFNNSTNLNQEPDPISLAIIQVICPVYRGELKVIESDNPFDEKLTLRHSGDFAGRGEEYLFEWRTLPPDNGLPSVLPREQWAPFGPKPPSGQGSVDITIEGPGIYTLSDNYFVCRYRPLDPGNPCGTNEWSDWTQPMLAEGWIKRVLAGINPFDQRFKSYENNKVDTIVSMISQAGPRAVGAVPLNAAGAQEYGLLEIYETVFRRGIGLSIEGAPPIDYGPANDALLLVASRISKLYMLLGNEAYADATDPTIAYGTESGQYGAEASSIHCFQNQLPSLLDEELALLRGRDNSQLPSIQTPPFYNRLIWNLTQGDGEVAYVANYGIRDKNGDQNLEDDAKVLFPQAHGDSWGHYLMGLKPYYRLLRSPFFTWIPRSEAVLVGGVPVSVDYFDERQFASAAAAKANAGAEIVNLTYRSYYVEDPAGQWQGYQDPNSEQAWGVSEWASRAGQGAYLDWVVGNALLPANSSNTGIQKVDRTTVTELRAIASTYATIQEQLDKADTGLNPLGLAKNALPFDINPTEVDQGTTHFEQIYLRAVRAMNNAIAVFNYANNSSQNLRRQADRVEDFQQTVIDREGDFKNRLIEIFGYPYADDIGPTGSYPSGYDGPDLYHYMYVDSSRLLGVATPPTHEFTLRTSDLVVSPNGAVSPTTSLIRFHVAGNGFGLIKPAHWTGQRRAPGEIQLAHLDLLQAKARFERSLIDYENLISGIEDQANLLHAQYKLNADEITLLNSGQGVQETLNQAIRRSRERQLDFQTKARIATLVANAVAEGIPKVYGVIAGMAGGVIGDWVSAVRAAVLTAGSVTTEIMTQQGNRESLAELDHQQAKELSQSQQNIKLTTLRQEQAILQQIAQIEQQVRQEAPLRLEIYNLQEALQQAAGRYASSLARGQRLMEDRLRFRQQTAGQVQAYRYNDMAFRIFRNDALQKYRAQFDMAAQYVYLAAKAYDFDTNLRPGDPSEPGSHFLNTIVRARTIGVIQNGEPLTGSLGDPGLANPMALMKNNFAVLKTQLGFNNPQPDVKEFSLRSQLFRIQPGATGNAKWRETLTRFIVPNLMDIPEFRRHCLFQPTLQQEPGLLIPMASTVDQNLNFFAWPADVAGDSGFNPTDFSTKVRAVRVSFSSYKVTGGAGLRDDPRVYLIPVGSDMMRSPRVNFFDSINFTREWKVQDQWLPAPFPISSKNDPRLSPASWIPQYDIQLLQGFGLSQMAEIRAHPSFEAWHDSRTGVNASDPQFQSARLIGRSVWNTQWILIIPAVNLLNDRQEGLQRFINGAQVSGQRDGNGISDIRIRFTAYAYSGR